MLIKYEQNSELLDQWIFHPSLCRLTHELCWISVSCSKLHN